MHVHLAAEGADLEGPPLARVVRRGGDGSRIQVVVLGKIQVLLHTRDSSE